jgi:hypothetical protein
MCAAASSLAPIVGRERQHEADLAREGDDGYGLGHAPAGDELARGVDGALQRAAVHARARVDGQHDAEAPSRRAVGGRHGHVGDPVAVLGDADVCRGQRLRPG